MLQEGWLEGFDERYQQPFYFCVQTQESTWIRPLATHTHQQPDTTYTHTTHTLTQQPQPTPTHGHGHVHDAPDQADGPHTPAADISALAAAVAMDDGAALEQPALDEPPRAPAPEPYAAESTAPQRSALVHDASTARAAEPTAELIAQSATAPEASGAEVQQASTKTPPTTSVEMVAPAAVTAASGSGTAADTVEVALHPVSCAASASESLEPAAASAASQTDGVDSAPPTAVAELAELRAMYGSMRKKYELLHSHLETDGIVLLRAARRRAEQWQAAQSQREAAAARSVATRDALAGRVSFACSRGALHLTFAGWRALTPSRRAAAAAALTPADTKVPPVRERADLYRMSYEALIDTVMEWQGVLAKAAAAPTGHAGASL